MCPSYMATLDEEHSTRGRANALRAVLSGKVPRSEFTGRRLYEVLDLCLECKACKAECPANVDMAKLKYEFLAHYYRANGLPAPQPALRPHPRAWPGSGRPWRRSRTGSRARRRTAGSSSVSPASTGGGRFRRSPASRSCAGSRAGGRRGTGRAGRGGALPRHVQHLPDAERRHRRDAPPGGARVPRRPGRPRLLRAAHDLQGHAATKRGRWRPTTSLASRPRRGGAADHRTRAVVPAHPPRRVPGARARRTTPGWSRGRASSSRSSCSGSGRRRGSHSSPRTAARRSSPRPLPPEGAGRDGPDGGGPQGGGLRGERGGRGLLRDGRARSASRRSTTTCP